MMNGLSNRLFGTTIVQIDLPDLGEGTKEATIKEWYVQPGTKVNEVSNNNNYILLSILLIFQII